MARKRVERDALAPTPEEWQRLYAAATAFKAVKPWHILTEDQGFSVEDPETGTLNYCIITGELGDHLALILCLGPEGLGAYYDAIRRIEDATGDLEEQDASICMLNAPQLQASFEDRDFLTDEDRRVIKDLKLRFRGRQAWPMFRSYHPGRLPWYITGAEARLLTVALEQALVVVGDADWVSAQYDERAEELDGTLPIRYLDGDTWRYRWEKPQPLFPQYEMPADEEWLTEMRRKLPQTKAELQFHMALLSGAIEDGPLPPYYAHLLLLVDVNSGMLLSQQVLLAKPSVEAMLQTIPSELIKMFEALKMRPETLQVATERLYRILALPAGLLGIRLLAKPELPMLEEGLAAVERFLRGEEDLFGEELEVEDWNEEDWDDLEWDIKEAA